MKFLFELNWISNNEFRIYSKLRTKWPQIFSTRNSQWKITKATRHYSILVFNNNKYFPKLMFLHLFYDNLFSMNSTEFPSSCLLYKMLTYLISFVNKWYIYMKINQLFKMYLSFKVLEIRVKCNQPKWRIIRRMRFNFYWKIK